MREYNCDLHIHSPYSGGVSQNMLIPVIAEQAKLKGLNVLSTGDIFNKKWLEHVKQNLAEEENGIFTDKKSQIYFIIGTEVECNAHIHHLLFFPDIESAQNMKEKMKGKADFEGYGCGRPKINLTAEEIAKLTIDCGGIVGSAHAFTPYFSVYAHADSVRKAYGEMGNEIDFIELGLSADSYFADLIAENHNYQFITASDAHSPWPHRIGREFTRIKMRAPNFKNLKKAFHEKEEALITLNAGLDPREGKYHCTACNLCYQKYSLKQAEQLHWRCSKCRGTIKKGVRDRILELATYHEEKHPKFRPKYLHLLPLAEIIQEALKVENVNSVRVQELWASFIQQFGNEINVLIDVPESELLSFNEKIAKKISAFRNGFVLYIPGGGGNYGKPIICNSKEEYLTKKEELAKELSCEQLADGQKTLAHFSERSEQVPLSKAK